MDENRQYALHMIRWLDKLKRPKNKLAKESFALVKAYWLDKEMVDLENLRNKLWSWINKNNGHEISNSKIAQMRMILCLTYEDNRELEDVGYFEDLLVSFGITYEEAYQRTEQTYPYRPDS